jgi:hypothetical protein
MNYKPLIVIDDDSPEIRRNFSLKSVKANVIVEVFETWDRTQEFITEHREQIDAVVLDAKGKLNADKGASEAHLFESHGWVKSLKIPYVIYTAYTEQLPMLEQQLDEGRVFTKGKHKEEDVFEYLKDEIARSPIVKLRNKYEPAFQPFYKGIIGKEFEHNLIELLFCLQDEDYKKKNLNVVRDLLESIYLSLIDNFIFIPDSFKNYNDKPNLEWCTRYLEGRDTNDGEGISHTCKLSIPTHIQYNLRYIKNMSSAFSHLSENAEVKNAFISATHSVIEILEWLPGFINENFD